MICFYIFAIIAIFCDSATPFTMTAATPVIYLMILKTI